MQIQSDKFIHFSLVYIDFEASILLFIRDIL